MKIKIKDNKNGLEKDTIVNIVFVDLSEDNTYNYAKDNKVNALDRLGHVCLGERELCDLEDANGDDWIFEEDFDFELTAHEIIILLEEDIDESLREKLEKAYSTLNS